MKCHDLTKRLGSSTESRMLLRHVIGLSDADLIIMDDIQMSEAQQAQLDDCIKQRLAGRPIAKIIGVKEFYGRDFIVSDDVLDPRPDSETLIDCVLNYAQGQRDLRVLDMGAGTGCLVLTLLAELSDMQGVASDISVDALSIAQQNARALNVDDRMQFIESNWFENVEGMFDVIISNPPYIESAVIPKLDVDVRKYDPILALDGGKNGLNPYEVILPQIRNYLKKGGFMALEHGYDQANRIAPLIAGAGLADIQMHSDLAGHNRIITAIHK